MTTPSSQPKANAPMLSQNPDPYATVNAHIVPPAWDSQDTVLPGQDPIATPTRSGMGARLLKVGVAVLAGLGLGWGGLQAYNAWKAPAVPEAVAVVQGPAPIVAGAVPAQPAAAAAVAQAGLQATLVMGERSYQLGADQVALPTGSRFQISVQSPQTGQLSIHTINPQGQASAQPLWSGRVVAGQTVTSSVLRLEGIKGRETLLIHLRPANGAAPLTHSAHLWHL